MLRAYEAEIDRIDHELYQLEDGERRGSPAAQDPAQRAARPAGREERAGGARSASRSSAATTGAWTGPSGATWWSFCAAWVCPTPRASPRGYPHELSGGMQQRIVIAIALACHPMLLIADEPTSNLDVTIQAQIVELIKELKQTIITSVLFITHDLGLVAEVCDRASVMYAGDVRETAAVRDLFREPLHPYTQGLLASVPKVEQRGSWPRSPAPCPT